MCSSDLSIPQSPVSAALHLIDQRRRHKLTGQSRQLKLKLLEYKDLWERLEERPKLKSFVIDRLGLEYNSLEEVLYIPRMPTTKHECFLEKVSTATKAQLEYIGKGNDEAAKFAARISSVRSGCIRLQEFNSDDEIDQDRPIIRRQPDDQFQHDDAEYPGVVYEIACSQDPRELVKAAWTYIPYSNANIKAVVGFELGYGKNKEARISMWQPRFMKEGEDGPETLDVEAVIDRDLFRSSDGVPTNTTKALHIPLDCFADSEVASIKSEGLPSITITYPQLAEFLDKAESLQRNTQPAFGEESTGKKSTRQFKKRKRDSTPAEQLSSDTERKFCEAESEAERRTVVEDTDFQDQTTGGIDIPERRQSRRM